MMCDVYDSDDARNPSPPLERQQVDIRPRESPPPWVPDKSESPPDKGSPSERDRKRPRRRRKKNGLLISDLLILKSLGHDRPDLVRDQEDIGSESDYDSASDQSEKEDVVGTSRGSPESSAHLGDVERDPQRTAQDVLNLIHPESSSKGFRGPKQIRTDQNAAEKTQPIQGTRWTLSQPPSPSTRTQRSSSRPQDVIGDLLRTGSGHQEYDYRHSRTMSSRMSERESSSLATSPVLRPHAILPSERPARETLPALHSPPGSISANSPENSQSLPSIKDTFAEQLSLTNMSNRVSGTSPSIYQSIGISAPAQPPILLEPSTRRLSEQYVPPPPLPSASSFSHMSPASSKDLSSVSPTPGPSPQTNWRSPFQPAEGHHSFSSSSQFGDSPSISYPTPTEPIKSEDKIDRPEPRTEHVLPNGPLNTSTFKCPFPGCKAPPFQTQYLLNSHANVHSQERPYFCPVKGCPRGEGGKGFKRKNEMMRHGLVHDSPGYICPFCPDQQHSYPRPDNLQRHVRFHHVDKDRDDPLLRSVLAQRPEGGMRGRRRRNNP